MQVLLLGGSPLLLSRDPQRPRHARAMGDAREHIKQRHAENCTRADPAYGAGVARALGITTQQQRTAAE